MEHSLLYYALAPLIGFVGMLSGGYWGVGCGWLMVPTLLLMGFTPMQSVGISLLQMIPSTAPTVVRDVQHVPWKPHTLGLALIIPLGIGSFATSFLGAPINTAMNEAFGPHALKMIFIVLMLYILFQTVFSRARTDAPDQTEYFTHKQTVLAWFCGLLAGILSSVLGIGGGMIFRPMLGGIFKVSEALLAKGVRILLLITVTAGGSAYAFSHGEIQTTMLIMAGLIGLGGTIGFPIGVKIHNIVAENSYVQYIHKSFAVVCIAVILNIVLNLLDCVLLSRLTMLGIALGLFIYLVGFAFYAKRRPKQSPAP